MMLDFTIQIGEYWSDSAGLSIWVVVSPEGRAHISGFSCIAGALVGFGWSVYMGRYFP